MRLFFSAFLFLFSIILFAQQPVKDITVKGKIMEEGSSYPLEYATVVFIDAQNNIVTGGITDGQGNYSIEVPTGLYTVQFEFISYKTKRLTNQNLSQNTALPPVSLAMDAAGLDEVVVRAETTEVQIRLDKKIYNIGKDLTSGGATVSDALNNVPSVTVDVEGAISLRGNENVRILINGKPSALAGFGSTDALRQLPAEAIDRIEVITSPSARYDAEGTAGILNIILKKENTLGINGSLSTNFTYPLGSNVSTNINLRTDKFNIFNTTSLSYRDSPGSAYFENRYKSDSIVNPFVIEERKYNRMNQGFNTNLGIEYYLTEKSSLTASGFFRLGDNKDVTINDTREFDREDVLATTRKRTETENEEDTSYQFSLNYVNNFDNDGHILTTDLQYENDEEIENSFINERQIFPIDSRLPAEDITTKETQKEYLAQIDYVRPIGENAQLEAGYRGNFQETATNYLLREEDGINGSFIRNDSLSNIFIYNENVNALYSQYGDKFGKFSFLLGLRLEHTQLKGEVAAENLNPANADIDFNFDKNYTGLFPTVNITYELSEMENITLGYNRRINRPNGWFINPFPSRASEANVFQGNPDLDPAYSSAFDLGYLKRWDKLTLTSSVYFQHETDAFERIQEDTGEVTQNGIPIIRSLPINLSTNQRYGFEAGMLYNPMDWLRLNGSFNYFKFVTEGFFNGTDYGTDNTSWFARFSSKISLPSKIEWQTNAFFRGPYNNAQTETEGIFSIDMALSKDIMEDQATLGFNVNDLLNSQRRKSFTDAETFTSRSEFQWRPRQFTVSFTYRFNQKKERQPSREVQSREEGFEG